MQLSFNCQIAANYANPAQIIRVLSESWVKESIYCPNCGGFNIEQYGNNKPVADFHCDKCNEDYEMNYPAASCEVSKSEQR